MGPQLRGQGQGHGQGEGQGEAVAGAQAVRRRGPLWAASRWRPKSGNDAVEQRRLSPGLCPGPRPLSPAGGCRAPRPHRHSPAGACPRPPCPSARPAAGGRGDRGAGEGVPPHQLVVGGRAASVTPQGECPSDSRSQRSRGTMGTPRVRDAATRCRRVLRHRGTATPHAVLSRCHRRGPHCKPGACTHRVQCTGARLACTLKASCYRHARILI